VLEDLARKIVSLLAALMMLILVATTSCLNNADELEGSHWMLLRLGGNNLLAGSYISVYFLKGHAWGYSGCNTYDVDYDTDATHKLTVSNLELTLIACSKAINAQETSYVNVLRNAVSYRLSGDKLVITNADQTTLVFARLPKYAMNPDDLVGTRWRLASVGGTVVSESLEATLNFDNAGKASGSAGSLSYEFRYEAKGDDIRFTTGGPTRATTISVAGDIERQADHFVSALGYAASFRLANGKLEIFTVTGNRDTLVLQPSP
jgi:heat shock protein HslJ